MTPDPSGGWEDPCQSGVPGMRLNPMRPLQAAIDDDGDLPPSLFHIPGVLPVIHPATEDILKTIAMIPEDLYDAPPRGAMVDTYNGQYGLPREYVTFDIGADVRRMAAERLRLIDADCQKAIDAFVEATLLKLIKRSGYSATTDLPRHRLELLRADIKQILEIILE